jgi:Viral (Superfamily 1) RNA helicase
MGLRPWKGSVSHLPILLRRLAEVEAGHSGGVKVLSPPLPPLAANYVERKLPMKFIEKALFDEGGMIRTGSKRIIVTGIGGCGKTQLIRKLIERCQHL